MNDSGFDFVKLMLKLTFPDMFEEGGDNAVDDTRKTIEDKIRGMAKRPETTAEELLTLSRAYSELTKNDWLARMPANPLLIGGAGDGGNLSTASGPPPLSGEAGE